MADLLGAVGAAAGVFAGTNVDDLVMLTVLFLAARATGSPRPWQIWAGQYAGIGVLVAVSAVAALGLAVVPANWVGLLGLVPFALGVRGLVVALRDGKHRRPIAATGVVSVVTVTVANGADNIAAYTPLFRTIGVADGLLTVAVFAVGVAVWCVAGSWLGGHQRIVAVARRYSHWIVPCVFMLIGTVIVVSSGVLGRLAAR